MTLHLYKILIVWIYDDTEWTNRKKHVLQWIKKWRGIVIDLLINIYMFPQICIWLIDITKLSVWFWPLQVFSVEHAVYVKTLQGMRN